MYLDICGRTVKLSFLSCDLKGAPSHGGKYTLLGSTYFVRTVVTCVMTSLKLFSFRNVENRLFSFSSMLDNDYWATEIIWRNLETD